MDTERLVLVLVGMALDLMRHRPAPVIQSTAVEKPTEDAVDDCIGVGQL